MCEIITPDNINIVCNVSMAFFTGVAAYVAFKWKSSTLTKAKMDVAGEVLAGGLEIEDLFKFICSPSRNNTERKSALKYYQERALPINTKRIDILIPLFRMEQNKDKFKIFFNLRNKVAIYWGEESIKSFDAIMKICQRIQQACDTLYNQTENTPVQQCQECEQIIYGYENSSVMMELNYTFETIRRNMNAVLGKRTKWQQKRKIT